MEKRNDLRVSNGTHIEHRRRCLSPNTVENEIAAAHHPGIRYFKLTRAAGNAPTDDVEGEWRILTPKTAAELSGVAYFFSRHLHGELGIPFGIIHSAWGGTSAEAWTGSRALLADPWLAEIVAEFDAEGEREKPRHESALADWEKLATAAKAAGEDAPQEPWKPRTVHPWNKPASLFNAMIAPLTAFPIRGVIWYQGENNANRGEAPIYRRLFRSMIGDWRHAWGQGAFPFLFVQLASYARVSETSLWPELSEAQAMALGLVGTGMAVSIDISDSTDIHPRNRQDVGLRLALAARAITYGEWDLSYSGPTYRQATREGAALRLWFEHADSGLEARDRALEGFELAGSDGEFVVADARIQGSTVILTSPGAQVPMQARYAWATNPKGNLTNAAGLPASPFRTRD